MESRRRGVLDRRGIVLLVTLVATMLGWIAFRRWEARRVSPAHEATALARRPFESLPAGAVVVAEFDLAALRSHPVTRDWLREPRMVEGLGNIGVLCGADPLDRVERLAVAIPSANDAGFGLVASGAPQPEAARCAEQVIERRGGTPARDVREGFTLVRDSRAPDGAMLAVGPRGLLLLAEPSYLTEIMHVVASPSSGGDARHAALRAAVGPGAVVVSVALTSELRATLNDELTKQHIASSPFTTLDGGAAALALGERLGFRALLAFGDADSATAARELIRAQLQSQGTTPLARLVGYASMLERVEVSTRGSAVELEADLAVEEFLGALRRLVTLQRLASQPAPSGPSSAVSPAPSAAPDAPRVPAN
ncbi:MAG: hypothetical protein FJ096_08100 [Deltaproteobacteria bacterium]|nr:hypothetical protein [Deltaproteobacteria bacterium]